MVRKTVLVMLLSLAVAALGAGNAGAYLPGGTLDPTSIPKYVEPLIIPPEMPASGEVRDKDMGGMKIPYYEIEVVEFMQQILPTTGYGPMGTMAFPQTRVWSYGALGQAWTRNYPAFTVEAKANKPTRVKWINNLVDGSGNALPHLLTGTVDQTVHWANPPGECENPAKDKDCVGTDQTPYTGPVPIVTHVHGSHVTPESDGYPEAWWLPAGNFTCKEDYADPADGDYWCYGSLYDQYDRTNTDRGTAVFEYHNDQRETTLWYHDHSLGMTRLNVYAGPAGFWLIRGGLQEDMLNLPNPAPKAKDIEKGKMKTYYEIPIVIQDRSFNADGTLFYPDNRAFFEEVDPGDLQIPFAPDSDVLPIWNPEAFFNTMVVNGRTWPFQDVDQSLYRFRLLNGCNSRFLNLSLFVVNNPHTEAETLGAEVPFYQIGTEGGLLPAVVKVQTGGALALAGDGSNPAVPVDPFGEQALLMAPAERSDVIVDFRGLPAGTVVRMFNTGPDSPFGGFPLDPADVADEETTRQVMEFVVGPMAGPVFTNPWDLVLAPRTDLVPTVAEARQVSLNEEESAEVCVFVDGDGEFIVPITEDVGSTPPDCDPGVSAPFGPTAALLGTVNGLGEGVPMLWMDPITENPALGSIETWEIHNFTEDAHPIHLHLVQFQVVDRIDALSVSRPPEVWESGWKDTVIAYPGEVTRINAHFDIPGLYVWHCHIVEHEDNEMMRPYCVGDLATYCPGL